MDTTGTAFWEHFDHPADMGIRGFGQMPEDAFAQAALALCAITVDLHTVSPDSSVQISLEETDLELLLVRWLNQILYEMNTRAMVFSRCEVAIQESQHQGYTLRATLWGEVFQAGRQGIGTEVKAATYAQLKVERQSDGLWMAQCVVDV